MFGQTTQLLAGRLLHTATTAAAAVVVVVVVVAALEAEAEQTEAKLRPWIAWPDARCSRRLPDASAPSRALRDTWRARTAADHSPPAMYFFF